MSIKTVEQKEDWLSIKIHFSMFLYSRIWNGYFKMMIFIERYTIAHSISIMLVHA